jgi:Ni2+-binding GTPase involved in maturation of urease and hydrogenase
MPQIRFVMLGGFLGAGKTTALARLGRHYLSRGQRVGLVTNDQAQGLVDTHSLRAQGFPVEEVPGACFCCRFDELVDKVKELRSKDFPDVVLAEPVGSCTDLVATVIQPLKDLCGDDFQVAPYGVIFKPSHGLRILSNVDNGGFSPKAAYIFRKQLEEADVILVNRIDELAPQALEQLSGLLAAQFPGTPLLRLSAKMGQGFDGFTEFLDQEGAFGRKLLNIDYDVYAEGEAELGWLNSSIHVSADRPFPLDPFLLDVLKQFREALAPLDAEIAHLKAIGLSEDTFAVANLVSSQSDPELSLPSQARVSEFDLVVNARVAVDPNVLEGRLGETLELACRNVGAKAEVRASQSFRPGRPQPTHRYAAAK